MHFKKFYPKLESQGPPDSGGSDGNGNSLFRHNRCRKKVSISKEASLMWLPLTLSSSQERLVGERVVVKEIEIFGNFWYPKINEDIGGARRMALCEHSCAN